MIKGKRYYYLIKFQYLGFRFHGWQKQKLTNKTVQGMLERTIRFIVDHDNFKTLGASRTDAMVSAFESLAVLTINEELNIDDFFIKLNKNLPQDIKALDFSETTEDFRVINDSKLKTYHYYFTNDEKPSPFTAPFMTNFKDELDIELMQKGAKVFEGFHNFSRYCFRPTPTKKYERSVDFCEVRLNTELTANFFPEKTYVLEVKGNGFLRNQIRLMMGALVMLGSKQISIEDLKESLIGEEFRLFAFVAPASGLFLKEILIENNGDN